jgi:hypothetical protein
MSDMDLSFLAAYMTTRSDIEVEIFALDLSLLKEVPTTYPRPGIWEKKTNLTKCGVPDESILVECTARCRDERWFKPARCSV